MEVSICIKLGLDESRERQSSNIPQRKMIVKKLGHQTLQENQKLRQMIKCSIQNVPFILPPW